MTSSSTDMSRSVCCAALDFCVLIFFFTQGFFFLLLEVTTTERIVSSQYVRFFWSFFLFLAPFYSLSRMRGSSSSPNCTEQAFDAAWMVVMNVWEVFRWKEHTHAEINYKTKGLYILKKRMLVVTTVLIHNKLQGRRAPQVLLLTFFISAFLKGNKRHILFSSSVLICCKSSVKSGHD